MKRGVQALSGSGRSPAGFLSVPSMTRMVAIQQTTKLAKYSVRNTSRLTGDDTYFSTARPTR